MISWIYVVVLLAAPACLLIGLAAGAILTHRLMTGQAPVRLPSILGKARKQRTEPAPMEHRQNVAA